MHWLTILLNETPVFSLSSMMRSKSAASKRMVRLMLESFSGDMTRRLAELLGMCDVCAASRPRTEPSDLTLSLMLYTHRCYVSGRLISG